MQTEQLLTILESSAEAARWLEPLGVANPRAAHASLSRIAEAGVPIDLLGVIVDQFTEAAPDLSDPDMALNNLQRFLSNARSPLSTATLFERDPQSLPRLLKLMSSSQSLSNLLITDSESYDLLRMTEGRPVGREVLVDELCGVVDPLRLDDEVLAALRRFKHRETLRIAYGDIVQDLPISVITRQISYVADAVVESALRRAMATVDHRGEEAGQGCTAPEGFVVLALGKLGGFELNYSSDIDLIFLFSPKRGSARSGQPDYRELERANRIGQEVVRLLTTATDLGLAYRVDMRLRPEGRTGPLCSTVESALTYYDLRGRTWERQAYVKARPIAGDLALGKAFLDQLEPWVYRRYLSLADIAGIKGLKRRIEDGAPSSEDKRTDLKTGRGGIRDIEFVIQFLQLLNGGALPEVRTGNTLEAIVSLEEAGCLTNQERSILDDNYCYLRRLEHRIQIMFDLQTHTLPADEERLSRLAKRMGYTGANRRELVEAFQRDYGQRTERNRKILDHLLHDAFGGDAEREPEVDLVNNPDPDEETIVRVMSKYPFRDPLSAYTNLMSLGDEKIHFLSPRRCRLFLAAIAPRLLEAIGETPDPDATLVSLSRVSDSIGGKAALWELFSENHPSLNLYVTLCAACPYLCGILTSNPGMVDELTDSLLTGDLPSQEMLEASLEELSRAAEDLQPILHSFKNAQHLRVGVRDILGKDRIEETHRTLSDIAEACLKTVIEAEMRKLEGRYGAPLVGPPPEDADGNVSPWHPEAEAVGERCGFVVLALGKLGAREPNYHSDLDLVFLYEAEGHTAATHRSQGGSTSNSHFFSELGQRIIQSASHFGPHGRLFEIDTRLRPTGRGGMLALPVDGLVRYFNDGGAQLWERLALCKARVVFGPERASAMAMRAVNEVAYGPEWKPENADEIRQMRYKLQESASPHNLKRSPGGTIDTEFVVQMLQLKHGGRMPELRIPGTLVGLEALNAAGLLSEEDTGLLDTAYRFQRSIESRIRLMDYAGRHEMPTDERDLAKLAFLLGHESPEKLREQVTGTFQNVRDTFERLFTEAAGGE